MNRALKFEKNILDQISHFLDQIPKIFRKMRLMQKPQKILNLERNMIFQMIINSCITGTKT